MPSLSRMAAFAAPHRLQSESRTSHSRPPQKETKSSKCSKGWQLDTLPALLTQSSSCYFAWRSLVSGLVNFFTLLNNHRPLLTIRIHVLEPVAVAPWHGGWSVVTNVIPWVSRHNGQMSWLGDDNFVARVPAVVLPDKGTTGK